jgi:hypothetical protein
VFMCVYSTLKCRINTVVSPDDGQIFAPNIQRLINKLRNKHTKKKLYTKLALFRRLSRDARSAKRKIQH